MYIYIQGLGFRYTYLRNCFVAKSQSNPAELSTHLWRSGVVRSKAPRFHSSSRPVPNNPDLGKAPKRQEFLDEAPSSGWLRTPSTVASASSKTKVAMGNLMHAKQLRDRDGGLLTGGVDSNKNRSESVDDLLSNWKLRSQRAEFFSSRLTGERIVTEETMDRWRTLMW